MPDVLRSLELTNHVSKPSQGLWVPYPEAEPHIRTDAERVWRSGLLDHLWVEVTDAPYTNGVGGKRVIFNMVRRAGEAVVPSGPPTVPAEFAEPAVGYLRVYP